MKKTEKVKKRKKITRTVTIIASIILITITILASIEYKNKYRINVKYPYTQEYVAGQGNIKGNVNTEYFEKLGENYAIGANAKGYAVFKNPKKAYKSFVNDFAKGIKIIQKELSISSISQENYDVYGTFGWQIKTKTNEEKRQVNFITDFVDIYENSFPTKIPGK